MVSFLLLLHHAIVSFGDSIKRCNIIETYMFASASGNTKNTYRLYLLSFKIPNSPFTHHFIHNQQGLHFEKVHIFCIFLHCFKHDWQDLQINVAKMLNIGHRFISGRKKRVYFPASVDLPLFVRVIDIKGFPTQVNSTDVIRICNCIQAAFVEEYKA
mmetsp:Transcript_12433/g.21047  ORF Transcript_12433/g.21047 Transcript_12433/m.21047 type:complete len:157 (-) Transcript_12433:632-1102(-)